MKLKFSLFVLVALILLVNISKTSACSCSPTDSVCGISNKLKDLNGKGAVFLGTVKSIEKVAVSLEEDKELFFIKKVLFETNESFAGEIKKEELIYTMPDGASCGYLFEVGKKYLVYAGYSEELKMFGTGLCSGNKDFISARNEIEVLRNLKQTGSVKPKIFGTVEVIGSKTEEKKLFQIAAKREGEGNIIEKSVESGSAFDFSNIRFGKYWFKITVDGVKFDISNPIELSENDACREIKISVSENELKYLQNIK